MMHKITLSRLHTRLVSSAAVFNAMLGTASGWWNNIDMPVTVLCARFRVSVGPSLPMTIIPWLQREGVLISGDEQQKVPHVA